MRILIVSPVFPMPLTSGTKVRLYNIIKGLRRRGHRIGLAALIHHDELPQVAGIRDWFTDLVLVPIRRPGEDFPPGGEPRAQLLPRTLMVAALWLQGLPLWVALMYQPKLRAAITRLLPTYDYVFVEFFFMALNLPAAAFGQERPKLILVEHDLSFIAQKRRYQVAQGWRRLSLWLNFVRYYRAEVATLRRFGSVAVMSDLDRETLLRLAPGRKIAVVPNGVDLGRYIFRTPGRLAGPPKLLFVGGLAHQPNFDALHHFIKEDLPRLLQRFPGLTLTVVGDSIGAGELVKLPAGKEVRFVRVVPELNPYLQESTALIVPLRIAGGTRLKIVEAMAAGLPVISSAVGAEGLAVANGRHLLLAETSEDYVAALERLTGEPGLAVKLATAARRLCEEKYDWQAITAGLEQELLTDPGENHGR